MPKRRFEVRLDDDVIAALRERGRELDPDKPWPATRVAGAALTEQFAGRAWIDKRKSCADEGERALA